MDVKIASNRTLEMALARPGEVPLLKTSKAHLIYMNRRIQAEEVTGEKAHRWLGWMQACAHITGVPHEELQQINKNA